MTNTNTKIEWTDATWSPVTGCTKVSAGCKHCYAETIANRFWRDRKFTDVQCHEDRLTAPLQWRKPRRVFVNSMSDLFHEDVPDEFIAKVFDVIRRCHAEKRGHTFQVLTKRPERMLRVMRQLRWDSCADLGSGYVWIADRDDAPGYPLGAGHRGSTGLANLWLGVSCENQAAADERIPLLLQTPAAVRFVSAEPLLGPIRFDRLRDDEIGARWPAFPGIDWVIVGGESGPRARPCDVGWIGSIVEQCKAAGVPCFVKQLGAMPLAWQTYQSPPRMACGCRGVGECPHIPVGAMPFLRLRDRKGGDPSEWPEHLRVREFPR